MPYYPRYSLYNSRPDTSSHRPSRYASHTSYRRPYSETYHGDYDGHRSSSRVRLPSLTNIHHRRVSEPNLPSQSEDSYRHCSYCSDAHHVDDVDHQPLPTLRLPSMRETRYPHVAEQRLPSITAYIPHPAPPRPDTTPYDGMLDEIRQLVRSIVDNELSRRTPTPPSIRVDLTPVPPRSTSVHPPIPGPLGGSPEYHALMQNIDRAWLDYERYMGSLRTTRAESSSFSVPDPSEGPPEWPERKALFPYADHYLRYAQYGYRTWVSRLQDQALNADSHPGTGNSSPPVRAAAGTGGQQPAQNPGDGAVLGDTQDEPSSGAEASAVAEDISVEGLAQRKEQQHMAEESGAEASSPVSSR